jgi:hypothetical protein
MQIFFLALKLQIAWHTEFVCELQDIQENIPADKLILYCTREHPLRAKSIYLLRK